MRSSSGPTRASRRSSCLRCGELDLRDAALVAAGPTGVAGKVHRVIACVAERFPPPLPQQVDAVVTKFGMPMGPLRLLDEVGLDVSRHAGQVVFEAFGERMKPAPPLVALEKSKRLGKKGGVGFYTYENGKEKEIDQSIYSELAIPKAGSTISEQDIQQRAVFVMINEAARILEDKIVATPGDVDLGMIMGTGFPPFRGGLLKYADKVGLPKIVNELERYQKQYGERFAPAPLLKQKAAAQETFYAAG